MKKIGSKALNKVLKDGFCDSATIVNWYDLDIECKKFLCFDDAISFSNHICDLCFLESGEYVPEMFDFALRSCVVEYYTNVSLPNNIDKRYEIVYGTDLYYTIYNKVDFAQLDELINCAFKRVSRRLELDKEDIKNRLNVLIEKFDDIADEISSVYENVDSDTMNSIANVAANLENMTEESVIRAYAKELANTGIKS